MRYTTEPFDGNKHPVSDVEIKGELPYTSTNYGNNHKGLIVDEGLLKSTFTAEYQSNQTNVAILTPPSGKRLCIRDVYSSTASATGEIALDFQQSGIKVFRQYVASQNRSDSRFGHLRGAVDEPLILNTTTGSNKLFLVVNYIIHD